jgi:hypothetical protein
VGDRHFRVPLLTTRMRSPDGIKSVNGYGSSSNPPGQPGFHQGGVTISNPDLSTVFPSQTTSYRGTRGESWIRGVPYAVGTNGYLTPNHSIPDITVHGRGWFASRSLHPGGEG